MPTETTSPQAAPATPPVDVTPPAEAPVAPAVAAVAPASALSEASVEAQAEAPAPAAIKVPTGYEPQAELLTATAKELGLEGPKAQKFADSLAAIADAQGKAIDAQLEAQESKWLEEAKADPDIGGAKWAASLTAINRALGKFGGPAVKVGDRQMPELAALLAKAGLGNNKLVLKAFAAVGHAMADDSIQGTAKSAAPSGERVSDAVALYGNPTTPART